MVDLEVFPVKIDHAFRSLFPERPVVRTIAFPGHRSCILCSAGGRL